MMEGDLASGVERGSGAAGVVPPAGALAPGREAAHRGAPLLRRLILLVAIVALPLLGLAGWSAWTAQDAVRRQAEETLLRRLETVALTVEREFDRAGTLLAALAASAALDRGDLAAFEAEMRASSTASGGAPIFLLGPDGNVLLNTLWAPGARREGVPAPETVLRVLHEDRTTVTNLFATPDGGRLVTAVVVALDAPSSRRGVAPAAIGLILPRETLSALLRTTSGIGEAEGALGWTAAIIDRDGIVVARSASDEGLAGQPARAATFQRLVSSPDGLLRNATTRDGIAAVIASQRGSGSGFFYSFTMPAAQFAAPVRATLLRVALGGGLVLASGVALAALLARRTVAAFRLARESAISRRAPATGLREADDLALALASAAADRDRAALALTESERRNRDILESLGENLYALDSQARLRFASRAALAGWGVSAERILGRHVLDVFPEAADSLAWQLVANGLAERQEAHFCAVSATIERWVEVDAYPSADGGITVAFHEVEDLRRATQERARAMEALHTSEERLRMALEAAEFGAWEVDLRAGVIRRSPRTLEIFGLPPEAALEAYPSNRGRLHPDDRAATVATFEAAIAGRIDSYKAEYRFLRPDGRWSWIESHARVVARDPTGRALRVAGASRDSSARRAAEERQALLSREVDHRAKNALAVVQAALRLTPKDDAAAFAKAIEGRVGALARAQTLLAADKWRAADLRALLVGELDAFIGGEGPGPKAVLEGPAVALSAAMTQPLAMAVHELATNAVKHGALAVPSGQVHVSWHVEAPREASRAPRLHLRWRETGGAMIAGPPSRRGFGSRVLEGTVRSQLGGMVTMSWAAHGLDCTLVVPLPADPAAASHAALQEATE